MHAIYKFGPDSKEFGILKFGILNYSNFPLFSRHLGFAAIFNCLKLINYHRLSFPMYKHIPFMQLTTKISNFDGIILIFHILAAILD